MFDASDANIARSGHGCNNESIWAIVSDSGSDSRSWAEARKRVAKDHIHNLAESLPLTRGRHVQGNSVRGSVFRLWRLTVARGGIGYASVRRWPTSKLHGCCIWHAHMPLNVLALNEKGGERKDLAAGGCRSGSVIAPQPNLGYPRSAMSNYPQPPPSYSPTKPAYGSTEDNREPLLGGRFSPQPGPSTGGIYNQPRLGDVPDDFKVSCRIRSLSCLATHKLTGVQYGVSVSESSLEIRNAFVRKVYTILCAFSPSPAGNHTTRITNPPRSLSSRTNRKPPLFCII